MRLTVGNNKLNVKGKYGLHISFLLKQYYKWSQTVNNSKSGPSVDFALQLSKKIIAAFNFIF